MNLYYDRISKMFTLETEDEVIFLGPLTHTLVLLRKKYELSADEAREGTLRAIFNAGFPVDIDNVKRIATKFIND